MSDKAYHFTENRVFEPSTAFLDSAQVSKTWYDNAKTDGLSDPIAFWKAQAEHVVWKKKWTKDLDWQLPRAKWFYDGELNVTDTCLDQHLTNGNANKPAIIWEGEPGDSRTLTYKELHADVIRFAGALQKAGLQKGDRVAIYMPLVPEAVVAMHACARLGATHSIVFGGFSADALKDRINDATCKMVITADGGYRKGKVLALKDVVDEALADNACPSIEHVFVLKRCHNDIQWTEGRDVWWHEAAANVLDTELVTESTAVDAEHPLFILYTSGTTGKPKGVVHSTGGYLTQASYTYRTVFDHKADDIFWCTADVGWITGHTYVAYGPLANGATLFMYEGAPTYPAADRFWELIEKYKVTVFYTAPTAIRAFMKLGEEHVKKHDLSSLRLLGTVGEPINPEAWMWYKDVIGGGDCPIVDTWWQTETGAIMISPVASAVPTKPGSATKPLPGIHLEVVRQDGSRCEDNEQGLLVAQHPWPSMMRTVWGDDERFYNTYWTQVEGCYFTGDGARRDADGYIWILGRVDDVVNVSGHRLGTMEVESALVNHTAVAEAAVVARKDEITGEAIVPFVTLKSGQVPSEELIVELKAQVVKDIGAFARPAEIRFADALPKTRSGKIMRRLLRELADKGKVSGDVTSLEDISVLATLEQNADNA